MSRTTTRLGEKLFYFLIISIFVWCCQSTGVHSMFVFGRWWSFIWDLWEEYLFDVSFLGIMHKLSKLNYIRQIQQFTCTSLLIDSHVVTLIMVQQKWTSIATHCTNTKCHIQTPTYRSGKKWVREKSIKPLMSWMCLRSLTATLSDSSSFIKSAFFSINSAIDFFTCFSVRFFSRTSLSCCYTVDKNGMKRVYELTQHFL